MHSSVITSAGVEMRFVIVACVITGRVNHAANENVVNALVCFSRAASKRDGRNATRAVSKPRTVIRAVIRFPRGRHQIEYNRIT